MRGMAAENAGMNDGSAVFLPAALTAAVLSGAHTVFTPEDTAEIIGITES